VHLQIVNTTSHTVKLFRVLLSNTQKSNRRLCNFILYRHKSHLFIGKVYLTTDCSYNRPTSSRTQFFPKFPPKNRLRCGWEERSHSWWPEERTARSGRASRRQAHRCSWRPDQEEMSAPRGGRTTIRQGRPQSV
jgi:hypothetical protein